MTEYKIVSADSIKNLHPDQGLLLDVRTDMEHGEKHMACGHIHVPLDQLNADRFMADHKLTKDSPVYILCRSGTRARKAADVFIEAGWTQIHVVEGGVTACEECGHTLSGHAVKSTSCCGGAKTMASCCAVKTPIPLERQVRIAAGLFVVIGAGLALAIDPLFALIPLGVGGGLIFAGITDRCGLALVLTKAPWNCTRPKQ